MKTILITGGTGFLGSNLLKKLIKSYKIILLKRSFSSTKKIGNIIRDTNLIMYDLDKISTKNIFKDNNIDYIIHTATCYGRNNENLDEIIKTNLLFPLQLLELSEEHNISKFINVDTNLPDSINYYSISKNQFTTYAKIKSAKNKLKFINLKTEHFYGPGDDNNKFIPFLIESLKYKAEIDLTKGEQKRDFIYIKDLINIFILLLDINIKENFFEIEVGTGKSIKIKDLVSFLRDKTNSKTKLNFGALEYRKGEPMDEKADIEELLKLGFINFTDIYEGLDETIKYYNN